MSSKKIYTTVGLSEPVMVVLRDHAKRQERSLAFIVEEALKFYFSGLLLETKKEMIHADKT